MSDLPEEGYRDFPMPELVAAQSRAWLGTAEAQRVVSPPRASSTVMLLRPAGAGGLGQWEQGGAGRHTGKGVEVFVLRRASSMPFAPGMVAFPGGGVDARDADPGVPWAGPSPEEWARRLEADDVTEARELVIAAAREVFEECGVLLAGGGPGEIVSDLTDPCWERERQALLDRTQSFGEMLARLGLVLRTDLLTARAHWITPTCEPRRYDTRFFAARMPEGQVADGLSTEAEHAGWVRPQALLAAQAEAREILLPPTQVMAEQLSRVSDLDAWLREDVQVRPVMPWPVERSGVLWMRAPVGADGHGVAAPDGAGD